MAKYRANIKDNCVYMFRGVNGAALYVGVTRDFQKRLDRHQRDSPWYGDVHTFTVTRCTDRRSAERLELDTIRREVPVHNKVGISVSSPLDRGLISHHVIREEFRCESRMREAAKAKENGDE